MHNKSCQGLSLVELMIATAIGLIITVLAINYLTHNLRTRNVNAAYVNLKDNGAVSLYFLARYTRESGLKTIPVFGDRSKAQGGCDASNPWCTQDNNSQSDRLAIRKVFPNDGLTACNGEVSPKGEELVEVFSMLQTADYKALVCQSYSLTDNSWLGSNTKRILQTGIDDFQVLFYEKNKITPVNANDVSDWGNIQGIEVAVLADSEIPAHLTSVKQAFSVLDRNTLQFDDRQARHIFQTTIEFNNKNFPDG